MYSDYHYNEQLEDELYREYDSEGSEADSELEFHLYSQLHYSSNTGEVSELEDKVKEVNESIQDEQFRSDTCALGQLSENRSPTLRTEIVQEDKINKKAKTAKKKEKPRCQRPSFEEVIVIDSSPDVVTLSEDSSDDKDGVCVLKGQKLPMRCTSTPAHQDKKRVIDAAHPLNSSGSDSESESQCVLSSSCSSDSEDLENWMILGHGQQEGDQSISLNLDGVVESDTDEEHGQWLISDKDREAQIYNKNSRVRPVVQRVTSRYYTEKNVHCRNCNRNGHLSKNCPDPKKGTSCFLCGTLGHQTRDCPNRYCNNCGLPGHVFSSCSERPFWHKNCYRCGMTGHLLNACPEIWRQYHKTIETGPPIKHEGKVQGRFPAYCYNCSSKGHFGHQCSKQRMFRGTFPSIPFITHYDTIEDIKLRQHKIKSMVHHRKNNGFTPHVRESPSTSEPPRKKQKISHDKSMYKHKPRQSFKTDLPASKHTFFGDISDPASKTNKHREFKVVSQEKPWKPKRPVPKSREKASNTVVVIDEDDDFPRGGGQGEEVEKKRKKKKMKKNVNSLSWTKAGKHGSFAEHAPSISDKRRKKWKKNKGNKNTGEQMYPTDENLFIIKQRKVKRS